MTPPLHVMTIFGTRPEAVKLAPVIAELLRRPEHFRVSVVVTGQHREMLDQFLSFFAIRPDADLNVMEEGQSVTQVTSRALSGLEEVLKERQPDIVLVQGDTATVFSAGLAAFYQQIPVGHVEAGLRSRNKFHPFPEEILRQMTSVLADLHFAPTCDARRNLLQEAVKPESIFVVGNTVVDALHSIIEQIPDARSQMPDGRSPDSDPKDGPSVSIRNPQSAIRNRMILITAHRRENLGQPMQDICAAILEILDRFADTRVVFPVHRNPAVRQVVFSMLKEHPRVQLCEPVDYLEFLTLMKQSHLILSDSGGVQEEAPVFGKPVLVLRTTTERPEGIKAGVAMLVGTDRKHIVEQASALLSDSSHYASMSRATNPYGDGQAASRIAQALLFHFGRAAQPPEEFAEAS